MTLEPPVDVLQKTPVFRMVHLDCLPTILTRNALHSPSGIPSDGSPWVSIHAAQVQASRGPTSIPCGPGGLIEDYVGFYFGPRSPMLLRIQTGRNVAKVDPEKIIYLVSIVQTIAAGGLRFVFSDRHSLAKVAAWRDSLSALNIVDFPVAYAKYWTDTVQQPDRQEKKQAEFLVHQTMPWSLITVIGVLNDSAKSKVLTILSQHPSVSHPQVLRKPSWYY